MIKKIINKYNAAIPMFIVLLIPALGLAQVPEYFELQSYENFDYEYTYFLVPKKAGENTEFHLFIKIPYNRLQFVRFEKFFRAEYEVTLELRDDDNELIYGKSWRETVQTNNYQETEEADIFHMAKTRILIEPGEYKLNVIVEDMETNLRIMKTREIDIDKHDKNKFSITSVILIENIEKKGDKIINYTPSITDYIEKTGKQYFDYFEIIPSKPGEKFNISIELKTIYRKKNETIFKDEFEKIAGIDNIQIATNISEHNLATGAYEIIYNVSAGWRNNKRIRKEFYISWVGAPTNEEELDLALEQMKYAFDKVLFKNIKKLTYEEKLDLFTSMWQGTDPFPETSRNELQEEYFRRVRYSNLMFTVFQDGWKTDRGLIYIIFGPPNEVIRFDYLLDSYPIQYWSYYKKNILFKFYDPYNIGDFMFIVPYNYDAWTRPIIK